MDPILKGGRVVVHSRGVDESKSKHELVKENGLAL